MRNALIFDPERLARIEQMINEFQAARERRCLRRAMKEWERAEAERSLLDLEKPPERVH
jgi:hypothetical protein